MARWMPALALGLACVATAARADELRFGWSVGVSQSAQTVLTDSPQAFALIPAVAGSTAASTVQRFTGLVFNTGVTANATIDVIGRALDQGLVFGVAFNQLLPTLLPDDLAPNSAPASTAVQLNVAYQARVTRARWNLTFTSGYAFGINGQLPLGADGGTGAAAGTLPGAQVGPLLVNGQTHNANARAALAFDRARWDGDLSLGYAFGINGIFTLAPGGNAGGQGSALGAFVPATTHTVSPAGQARFRVGPRGTLVTNLGANLLVPVEVALEDGLVQNLLPESLTTNAAASYEHRYREENRWFVTGTLGFNLRAPTDLTAGAAGGVTGRPLTDPVSGATLGLRPDTLMWMVEAGLAGTFRRIDLRYRASVGVAQPRLYQPPLGGASQRFPVYEDAVVGELSPVASVALDRRFDPIDLTLTAQRQVAVGGLGASANIADTISLAARYDVPLWSQISTLTLNAGVNAARTRSVGRELIPIAPDANAAGQALVLLANGNDSIGVTFGLALPLFSDGGLRVDFDAAYALTYNDPTAGLEEGQAVPGGLLSFTSHALFGTVRGTWGRGPLETAGDEQRTQENAFAQNPRTGSPLVSARLLNLRSESQRGVAPGLPSADRRAGPPPQNKTQKGAATSVGQSEGVTMVTGSSGAQLTADAPPPSGATESAPRPSLPFVPMPDEPSRPPPAPPPVPPPSAPAKGKPVAEPTAGTKRKKHAKEAAAEKDTTDGGNSEDGAEVEVDGP